MTENAFKASDIGLRAQKKILSRMSNKNVVKVFIDDNSASLLDNLYKLAKIHVCVFRVVIAYFKTALFNFQIFVLVWK